MKTTLFLIAAALLLPQIAATANPPTSAVKAPAHHRHVHHAKKAVHAAAKPAGAQVWVNTKTGVYHLPGTRWYGRTAEGSYMSETAARAEGDRAAENNQ